MTMPLNSERKSDILKLLKSYSKEQGIPEDSRIGFLSGNDNIGIISHIATGNLGFDTLTNGGLIKGKVNILYGGENSGKSTLTLDAIAYQMQEDPEFVAAICDNEKVFDREYALSKDIDPDRLIVGADFKTAEQAYDFCNTMAESNLIDMLVVDTIQALASKGEIVTKKGKQKSTADDTMALIPRLLSQFLRMYTSQTSGDTTLVLLSQVRLDLGSFMPSSKKTGGKAIDHYNVLTVKLVSTKAHSGSEKNGTNWPWTIAAESDAPPKSFTLKMKIDKAKMQGRYDGNILTMYFHKGVFEERLNALAIARCLGLHDGKTLRYFVPAINDVPQIEIADIEQEFKAKGFKDMYNRVPDEAIAWLKSRLLEEYTKNISFLKEDVDEDTIDE